MLLTGYPKGRRVYALIVKSLMGTASKSFKERRHLSERLLYLLGDLSDISENCFGAKTAYSLLTAAALEHKISFFPVQKLCTLLIFDFPFLPGKEEAKTIYYSLCYELLGHNKNE